MLKQLRAKPLIDSSVLYMDRATPSPLKLKTSKVCGALPSSGVNVIVSFPFPLITVSDSKVIVFDIDIQVGKDQFVLYEFPDDSGHFIPIQLYDGVGNFDFFWHISSILLQKGEQTYVKMTNPFDFSIFVVCSNH